MNKRTTTLTLALALLCAPLALADDAAQGSFARTLKVSGPVDLEVRTGSGKIGIRNGDAATVQINATIRAGSDWTAWFHGASAEERIKAIQANPPIEQNGNSIRVGFHHDDALYRNISISYDIVVPAETKVRSHTGSGSQTIEGVRGPVEANAGSGSLKIVDVDQGLVAGTGSGSIEMDGVGGNITAHAGSGSIRGNHLGGGMQSSAAAGGTSGGVLKASARNSSTQASPSRSSSGSAPRLELQTGSGNIRLENVVGALRAQTGSGSIEAGGEPEGNWELRTGSGGVEVRLPQSAAFNFYGHTGSGSITVDHPLTIEGTVSKREIRGKVRGGGFGLDIRTGSGGIHVQ